MKASAVAATFETLRAVRTFVLVNSTMEQLKPAYDSVIMIVPPRDEVCPSNGDNFCAYLDPATGKPIPGTLVVKDITRVDGSGSWNAAVAIREALGIEERNGQFFYAFKYGARGISVLLGGCSREEIEQVRATGMERAREFELGMSLVSVKSFEETNLNRQKAGLPELPPTEEYLTNLETVKTIREAKQKELLKRFDMVPEGPPVRAPRVPPPPVKTV